MAVVTPPFKNPNPLPNEACFLYVLEGENHSYSEEAHLHLQQDEGVLMKCGNYLYEGVGDQKSGQFGLLAVHFYPEVLKEIYGREIPDFLKSGATPPSTSMTHIKANFLIRKFVDEILYYLDAPELHTDELVTIKLKEIILLLLKTENADRVLEIIQNFFSPRIFSLKEVVESHIFSALAIGDLASLCNLSLASFKRDFQKAYHDSPANYIKNRRLEKAAELLLISNEPVSSIAYDCQFNNVAHFSSSFREKYGLSPTEYRLSQSQ